MVKGGETPRELAQRSEAYIRNVSGHVFGVVLNNLDVRSDDYCYYRYYRYGYYGPGDESGSAPAVSSKLGDHLAPSATL